MLFVLLLFLLVFVSIYTCCCICDDNIVGVGAAIISLFLFFTVIGVHYNDVQKGKIEALKSVGIEPLSTTQVYEMSKKELDTCKVINTLGKTYYFELGEKNGR